MSTIISIDGNVHGPEDARVSVLDHGFLFGDSVYEVVRTRGGSLFLLADHMKRLRASAERIYLRIPFDDEEAKREIEGLLERAGNPESYVRIIVTRGVGALELAPDTCRRSSVIVVVKPLGSVPAETLAHGVSLAVVERRRMDPRSLDPAAKTGNYLNNVLAMVEARRQGADDAAMLNAEGCLTELTTANLFLVADGTVCTPSLDCGILEGITRGYVIRLLKAEGTLVEEKKLLPADLFRADEAFLTSTTRDVVPVCRVDGSEIGSGAPGPVTRRLIDHFRTLRMKARR